MSMSDFVVKIAQMQKGVSLLLVLAGPLIFSSVPNENHNIRVYEYLKLEQ